MRLRILQLLFLLTIVVAVFCLFDKDVQIEEEILSYERNWRLEFDSFVKKTLDVSYQKKREEFGVFKVSSDLKKQKPQLLSKKVLLLVHGLDESGDIWDDLISSFPYASRMDICEFIYPNDQAIRKSVDLFIQSLKELKEIGVDQLWVVAHSMGGLLVRDALHNPNYKSASWIEFEVFPKFQRVFMVGSPHQGSIWARFQTISEIREQWQRFLKGRFSLYDFLLDGSGIASLDLLPNSSFIENLNSYRWNSSIPVTAIAGKAAPFDSIYFDRSVNKMLKESGGDLSLPVSQWNDSFIRLVNGFGDGVVSIESTHFVGLEDHITVEADHISLLRSSGTTPAPALNIIYQRILEDKSSGAFKRVNNYE